MQRQVQPHFLFNSLNTIYALVRKKHPESENAILTLSNLLRYTINKSDKNAVLLSDEISYMNEYITLQQLRLNSPEKVHFEVHDDFEKPVHVLPSLFIVFLENAFKYTDLDREDGGIRVNLNVTEHRINLEIWNSTSSESENNQHSSLEVRNGTGISNAQKRLELHYLGKHKLQTKSEQDHYWIKLEIDL